MRKKIRRPRTVATKARRAPVRSKPAAAAPSRAPNIESHSYSPEMGQLTVTFHGGRRYRYDDVPADIAKAFGGSGTYLHAHIIGKFKMHRLEP